MCASKSTVVFGSGDARPKTAQEPRGRYVTPRCFVDGCYCHTVLLTDPVSGTGLCEFHAAAEDSSTWPKITDILYRSTTREMLKALYVLDLCKHEGYAKCKGAIAAVQKAGLACGMSRDELKLREVEVFKYGQKCVETEMPTAFHYRISMRLVSFVVQQARPADVARNTPDNGMQSLDDALKFLAGELMPSHIRPAEHQAF